MCTVLFPKSNLRAISTGDGGGYEAVGLLEFRPIGTDDDGNDGFCCGVYPGKIYESESAGVIIPAQKDLTDTLLEQQAWPAYFCAFCSGVFHICSYQTLSERILMIRCKRSIGVIKSIIGHSYKGGIF